MEGVQVRSADGAGGDTNDDVGRALQRRIRDALDPDISLAIQNARSHDSLTPEGEMWSLPGPVTSSGGRVCRIGRGSVTSGVMRASP